MKTCVYLSTERCKIECTVPVHCYWSNREVRLVQWKLSESDVSHQLVWWGLSVPSCIESPKDLVHAVVRIRVGVKGWSFTEGVLVVWHQTVANCGGNIKWIVHREILCNDVNGQLRMLMHQHETHTVFISGVPSRDRLSSENPHGMWWVALVTCWFNYRFD